MKRLKRNRWVRIALYLVVLAGLCVGLFYLFQYLITYFGISEEKLQNFASTAYLVVFGVTLLSNMAILVPVVFHVSIMMAAARYWDPVLIGLVASVGGVLGELTGYYAGYLGKKIIRLEGAPGYERLVSWMERYGPWGIFLICVQPILPVDIAGLLAGASKLTLWKFLLPCWAGKLCKYVVACYLGTALWRFLPFLPP